jgi:DNA-binding response OmpR family regulator
MSKRQILLVGGDPDITRTLEVYLTAHQFFVRTVHRGDEALNLCHQSPPEAVIINWHLPDMAGFDLCRQIRLHKQMGDSFILALLSTNERDVRLAALEAGADDVMAQPIDMENLRLVLCQR